MWYLFSAVVTLATGLSLTAIASVVLPTTAVLSRRAFVAIGVAAAVPGFLVAISLDVLFGIIVTAIAAFLFVFLYDRFAAK